MKKITKNYNNPPKKLIDKATMNQLELALVEMDKHKFTTGIYRHNDVLTVLSSIYNNKCAFCESDTTAGAPMQVEHYRPKAKITGIAGQSGYYWLGYEWTNLLLACSSCNNKKRNNFPIDPLGKRVLIHPVSNGTINILESRADSKTLLDEKPLLINPELEPDTRSYFVFSPNGIISGLNAKAINTIKYCGLNRPYLVIKRKQLYDELFNKFMKHFKKLKDKSIQKNEINGLLIDTIEDLITHLANDGIYYEFAWTCWTKFPEFFISRFQNTEAKLLTDAYNEVLHELKNA